MNFKAIMVRWFWKKNARKIYQNVTVNNNFDMTSVTLINVKKIFVPKTIHQKVFYPMTANINNWMQPA